MSRFVGGQSWIVPHQAGWRDQAYGDDGSSGTGEEFSDHD